MNNVIVTFKVCIVLFFIAIALPHVNQTNWIPYFPFGWGGTMVSGRSLSSSPISASMRFRRPRKSRSIRSAICRSALSAVSAICTVLYIIVAAILTGVVKYNHLNVPQPVSYAIDQLGMPWASALIAIGAIAGLHDGFAGHDVRATARVFLDVA